MKHYIIVKWQEDTDKISTAKAVKELYKRAVDIEGVNGVEIKDNVTDRPNRYDIMIILDIDDDKLPIWDSSELHKKWKEIYTPITEKKCIFDSEF